MPLSLGSAKSLGFDSNPEVRRNPEVPGTASRHPARGAEKEMGCFWVAPAPSWRTERGGGTIGRRLWCRGADDDLRLLRAVHPHGERLAGAPHAEAAVADRRADGQDQVARQLFAGVERIVSYFHYRPKVDFAQSKMRIAADCGGDSALVEFRLGRRYAVARRTLPPLRKGEYVEWRQNLGGESHETGRSHR